MLVWFFVGCRFFLFIFLSIPMQIQSDFAIDSLLSLINFAFDLPVFNLNLSIKIFLMQTYGFNRFLMAWNKAAQRAAPKFERVSSLTSSTAYLKNSEGYRLLKSPRQTVIHFLTKNMNIIEYQKCIIYILFWCLSLLTILCSGDGGGSGGGMVLILFFEI